MSVTFRKVVHYRTYRLNDTLVTLGIEERGVLYRLKRQVDGLHPTLEVFTRPLPIKLLSFLATLKGAFKVNGEPKAAACRGLQYYQEGEAKDVFEAETMSGDNGHRDQGTKYHIIHGLLSHFLTDDVLQTAFNSVSRVKQREDEDEGAFV